MIDLLECPDTIEWLGVSYRPILTNAATGGAMSIVDSLSPVGSGPPRHIHEREDETFVLLSGLCEFWVEGDRFTKKAGETVFVPRGMEHTFRVIGGMPSRHLVILTPGGFEDFFADMAAGKFQIPQDMNRIAESAGRHHLRFTGPPLGND
ncbi:cupin domain-containing protein [Rhizobium leguminosarum]|uniref:cupin domain-containing protein n=1 Tax=Rhizobium leguminosarum TaxID=384 RepID=UPI001C962875|nr:cupin domain-containing protein [Rhizobium leguminosarum]MBY5413104.1 cupin domain-containing protein [Rhizobium leguminosarum]